MTFSFENSFVLICVYLCLVRPLEQQRRRMFRACTASSAAFIAQSYMTRMEMGAAALQKPTLPKVVEEEEQHQRQTETNQDNKDIGADEAEEKNQVYHL